MPRLGDISGCRGRDRLDIAGRAIHCGFLISRWRSGITQFKIALARCLRLPLLMLPVFSTLVLSNFMRAEEPAAPSTISTIHFRSPGGSSIVVPVYINDSGPFEFLLDTGSTITFIDSELL